MVVVLWDLDGIRHERFCGSQLINWLLKVLDLYGGSLRRTLLINCMNTQD